MQLVAAFGFAASRAARRQFVPYLVGAFECNHFHHKDTLLDMPQLSKSGVILKRSGLDSVQLLKPQSVVGFPRGVPFAVRRLFPAG